MPRLTALERQKAREASARTHARHVLTTYGITGEEYQACYIYQSGKCAICAKATGRSKRLAVDHDHNARCPHVHDPHKGCAACVRGLLCGPCNRFLGRLGDDPEAFDRAAAYLRRPPFQRMRMKEAV